MLGGERGPPVSEHHRCRKQVANGHHDHDEVQQEKRRYEHDRDANCLGEAAQKDNAQPRQQRERDRYLLSLRRFRHEGILDQVRGCIGGRQRHGDHEIGGREAKQDQNGDLAAPSRQQLRQHGNRTRTMRALPSHPPVDRKGAKEGDEHEHDRREGGDGPGRQCRNGGLVAERRKNSRGPSST